MRRDYGRGERKTEVMRNMTEKLKLRLSKIERREAITNDDELIEALEEIISSENQKPLREADTDLISECVDMMLNVEGIDLNAIKRDDEVRSARIKTKVQRRQIKYNITNSKVFRPVASIVCVVFVLSIANTIANAMGFDPVKRIIHDLFNIPVGESISEGDHEYIHGGETVSFDTVEDLLEKHQLMILYPSYLPQGITLNKIGDRAGANNDSTFTFEFSSDALVYIIDTYEVFDYSTLEGQLPTYESNDIVYYILDEQWRYTVYFESQNIQYRLQYNDYDELIKIINSVEEYK